MAVAATWKPPKLIDGKFASQADADAFKQAISNTGVKHVDGERGGSTSYDYQQIANNKAAADWGVANGFYKYPTGGSGFNWHDFTSEVLPILAVAAPAIAGVGFGVGAGASGGTGLAAGETGAEIAPGMYDVASAVAPEAAMGAAEYPGIAAATTAAPAGVAVANQTGTGAGVGSGSTAGNQAAAAAQATGAGSSAVNAPSTLSMLKDFGGLALTLGGLIAGGEGDVMSEDPSAPAPSPDSQAARQPDEVARRKAAAATGSTDNTLLTGASGIDPFSLNIGRSKLLGQ